MKRKTKISLRQFFNWLICYKVTVLLVFIFHLLILSAWGQGKNKDPLIEITPAHENKAIAVTMAEIPGQKFILTFPELFTPQNFEWGMFNHAREQTWNIKRNGADVYVEDQNFNYSIRLSAKKATHKISLIWEIRFHNGSSDTILDLSAFNCMSLFEAPLFKDIEMERTWVLDSTGNKTLLKHIPKTQGPGLRTMQFYPAINGTSDLVNSSFMKRWGVVSPAFLTGKNISVVSIDSVWTIENKVDGDVAYFFNNWEDDHGCIHTAPLLSRILKPGKTAAATGKIDFIRNR